jgi:hypothetical protein
LGYLDGEGMKRYIVEATTKFEISFDEKSETFQQAMKDFRATIYKGAKEIDIVEQVAHHLITRDLDSMVEGLGYVSHEYKTVEKKDPESGVMVNTDDLIYEFDIKETLPF